VRPWNKFLLDESRSAVITTEMASTCLLVTDDDQLVPAAAAAAAALSLSDKRAHRSSSRGPDGAIAAVLERRLRSPRCAPDVSDQSPPGDRRPL